MFPQILYLFGHDKKIKFYFKIWCGISSTFFIFLFFVINAYVIKKIHSLMTSLHSDAIGFLFQSRIVTAHFLAIEWREEFEEKKQLASSSSYEKMWSWFPLHMCENDDKVTTFAVGGDVRVKQQYIRKFLL